MEQFGLVLIFFVCSCVSITLNNNGYEGIVLTISDRIPEDQNLLNKIKDWLTEASSKLYIASKNHVYLSDITIRVPANWTNNGQYSSVTESSMKNAHIKIDQENPRFGQNPYTYGVTGCGDQGQFIHFTPEVVKNGNTGRFGNLGVVFVHEWGHFRWGLFEEYPSLPDIRNPAFYEKFYQEDGNWKPVRCTSEVDGVIEHKHKKTECGLDGETGKPELDCTFTPHTDERATAQASLMGHSFVPTIAHFCDDTPNNPATNHNKLAPNFQNFRCNRTSSWGVMRRHQDFKNNSAGSPSLDTTPLLRVVQTVPDKICLVIDVSGSMWNRIKPTRNAVASLIKYVIPDNAYLGIVKFSSVAIRLKNMTEITSDFDRSNLVTYIPTSASGGTSIGGGLLKGLETLTDLENTTGSVIYLATDGQENIPPMIADVLPRLIGQGVIVHTLAITAAADSKLTEISRATGGSSYFFSETVTNSTTLVDALSEPFSDSPTDPVIRILSAPVSFTEDEIFDTSFYIDDSIGRDTVIQFTSSDVNGVNLTVTSQGNSYTTIGTTADPGVIGIKIPGKASGGKYTVTVSSPQSVTGTLVAQSKSYEIGSESLQMKAWTTTTDVSYAINVQFPVFVSILKGSAPVTKAEVKVFIENEKGETSSLILKDNGIGADVIANDGIYSGYVLPSLISSNGRHSFKAIAEGVNSSVVVPIARAPGIGDENILLEEKQVSPFMRVALAKEVVVTDYVAVDSTVDGIPPSQITTLSLSTVYYNNNTYTVTWKAVGDDFDTGRATMYDLIISKTYAGLTNDIEKQDIIPINITPKEAGDGESFTFTVEGSKENETYFIAIRAVDESNNTGDISNILTVSILSKSSHWREVKPVQVPTDLYFDNSQNVFLFGIISGAIVLAAAILAIHIFIYFRKRNITNDKI